MARNMHNFVRNGAPLFRKGERHDCVNFGKNPEEKKIYNEAKGRLRNDRSLERR